MCFMTSEASLVLRFIRLLAVDESPESPTTSRRVEFRIFNHDLYRCGRAGDGSGIELRRRSFFPSHFHEDRSIRERKCSTRVRIDCLSIPKHGAKLVQWSRFA